MDAAETCVVLMYGGESPSLIHYGRWQSEFAFSQLYRRHFSRSLPKAKIHNLLFRKQLG